MMKRSPFTSRLILRNIRNQNLLIFVYDLISILWNSVDTLKTIPKAQLGQSFDATRLK